MPKRKQPEPQSSQRVEFEDWQGSDDEGSSDDEVGNTKERLLNRGVMQGAYVKKVLTKKGAKNVYAVITDLGAGLEGFIPISSMADDPDLRDILSHKLLHLRTGEAPPAGQPDRRSKISHVMAIDQGIHSNQLLMSALGSKVCTSMKDDWSNLPSTASSLLSYLYDRDRVCEVSHLSNLRTGQLLDGVVQRRTNEGVIASLTTGYSKRNTHPIMGVAVGANAVSTDTTGTTTREIGTPSSIPGTPGGRTPSAGGLRCRVIDCDPENGIVDFSCNPAVTNCPTALDRRTALTTFKNLAKKLKKTIPVQVILRKPTYAIVISRPYSGVLGYLALPESESERNRVKAGERLSAVIEYVRIRPLPTMVQTKRAKWVDQGRQVVEDNDDIEERKRTNLARTPDDPWLCEESFVVLSLQPNEEPVQDVVMEKPKVISKVDQSDAIEVGFDWQNDSSEDESSKKKTEVTKSSKKKSSQKNNKETELQIDKVERSRAEGGPAKTTEDFDRLVMASPHSSYVWCQYMAFHMSNREFEQSRVVAERALKTISYRETGELHNVWVAYLNLENLHGTTESLNAVFTRFLQHSDNQLSAYKALLEIAKASKHNVLAERTYQTILKKFGRSSDPWIDYAQYLLSLGAQDALNKLQKRMLANEQLTSKQQIDILLKYGRMQYRQGSIDKGRTIFEGLLLKHPKRTDIWSVYLDMERVVLPRLDDMHRIRNVFDRVTSLNLSSKKMQQFMTKYLAFEREKGDEERVEYVKKRAQEYVNAKLGIADDDE